MSLFKSAAMSRYVIFLGGPSAVEFDMPTPGIQSHIVEDVTLARERIAGQT